MDDVLDAVIELLAGGDHAAADALAGSAGHAFAAGFEESEHPREHGKFAPKGGGSSGGGTPAGGGDSGPSRPGGRHKTGAVKVLKWKPPPPPRGAAAGSGKAERPRGDRSQTKLGDHAEELARSLGYRSILPPGRRSNLNVAREGSSIDLEDDHSGVACELKMCSVNATDYRAKPKRSEIDDKEKYAKIHRLKIRTTLCVYDAESGEAHFYQSKEFGIVTRKLSEDAYDYVGTVRFGGK